MSQSAPMLSMSGTFLSNQILPIKGKWEALKQRKLNIADLREDDQNQNEAAHRSPEMELDVMVGRSSLDQVVDTNRLENNSVRQLTSNAMETSSTIASGQDDEMLSWLHYPMDESFERNYCSQVFSDSGLQLHPNNSGRRTQIGTATTNSTSVVSLVQRPSNAEAAMALGAERAAGRSSQVGLEAFSRVRTSSQPVPSQPVPKWPSGLPPVPPAPSSTDLVNARQASGTHSAPLAAGSSNSLGFKSLSEQGVLKVVEKPGLLIAESVSPLQRLESSEQRRGPVKKEQPGSLTSAGGSSSCRTKSFENEESLTALKKNDPEPTITSSSGGSDNTTEKSEKAERTKRKAKQIDSTECCQSETFSCRQDAEAESVDTKKTTPTRPKRSRAAEVHNLSERRRRDRINEKMRALQELIPNSNKTDKASMLDEAIEYLKMLQLQLQMMSMRSGMSLPPMVIPNGVHQHMQMPQMTSLAPYGMGMGMGMMGMNMGMGMGMGMNLVDLGSPSSIRPVVSEASTQQHHHQQHQHQHQHQQQQQLLGENSYNVFVTQQQMPVPVQVVSREMYNSYMVPVNQSSHLQESQQPQQQQQQLQQFHHQHHSNGFN